MAHALPVPAGVSRSTMWHKLVSTRRALNREREDSGASLMGAAADLGVAAAIGFQRGRMPQYNQLGPVDSRLVVGAAALGWALWRKNAPKAALIVARATLIPLAAEFGQARGQGA